MKETLDNLEKYDGVHQVNKMGKHFNKRTCKGKEYNTCGKQTCEIYVKQTLETFRKDVKNQTVKHPVLP